MQLCRTGASELLFNKDKDNYFDVGAFKLFFQVLLFSYYQPESLNLKSNAFELKQRSHGVSMVTVSGIQRK